MLENKFLEATKKVLPDKLKEILENTQKGIYGRKFQRNQKFLSSPIYNEEKNWAKQDHKLRTGETETAKALKDLMRKIGEALLGVTGASIGTAVASPILPLFIPGLSGLQFFDQDDSDGLGHNPYLDATILAQLHPPTIDVADHHRVHLDVAPDHTQSINALLNTENNETEIQDPQACSFAWSTETVIGDMVPELLQPQLDHMPCTITYDSTTNQYTIELSPPDFSHMPEDARTVLLAPITALVAGNEGDAPQSVVVLAFKSDRNENLTNALCISDVLSSLLFNIPPHGSGLAASNEQTTACYDAAIEPITVLVTDANGVRHQVVLKVKDNGNMLLFPFSPFDQTITLAGGEPRPIAEIPDLLLKALRGRFGWGDPHLVVYAPNGVDIRAQTEGLPAYIAPTPEPPPTPTPTPQPPAPIEHTNQGVAEVKLAEYPPRTVLGDTLELSVSSNDGYHPTIYRIDADFDPLQILTDPSRAGEIFASQNSGKLINAITAEATTDLGEKIANWWNFTLRGKSIPENQVKVVDLGDRTIRFDQVLYAAQDTNGGTSSFIATRQVEGETRYYLIRGKAETFASATNSSLTKNGQEDPQGTAKWKEMQNNTHENHPEENIVITPPHSVVAEDVGNYLFTNAEAYSNQTVTVYQITPEGYQPAVLAMGTRGEHNGFTYKHPDGQLYIGITAFTSSGATIGEFLVPATHLSLNE